MCECVNGVNDRHQLYSALDEGRFINAVHLASGRGFVTVIANTVQVVSADGGFVVSCLL